MRQIPRWQLSWFLDWGLALLLANVRHGKTMALARPLTVSHDDKIEINVLESRGRAKVRTGAGSMKSHFQLTIIATTSRIPEIDFDRWPNYIHSSSSADRDAASFT